MQQYCGMAATEPVHEVVAVQTRGLIALPAALRRKYQLDQPGAQVELTERADGVIELRPLVAVPAAQAWFWDASWQSRELEVDVHIAHGEVQEFQDADAFATHLDKLSKQ
jgi:bifunctional DNA-binding transcriptional regulator/antitoxin component of YhaV-PrlF toxin-antitoxin module